MFRNSRPLSLNVALNFDIRRRRSNKIRRRHISPVYFTLEKISHPFMKIIQIFIENKIKKKH